MGQSRRVGVSELGLAKLCLLELYVHRQLYNPADPLLSHEIFLPFKGSKWVEILEVKYFVNHKVLCIHQDS